MFISVVEQNKMTFTHSLTLFQLLLYSVDVSAIRFPSDGGFSASGIEGRKFTNVDLSGGDWTDFDDDRECAVSIMNIETKLERF
jgi:hypothetical protein